MRTCVRLKLHLDQHAKARRDEKKMFFFEVFVNVANFAKQANRVKAE